MAMDFRIQTDLSGRKVVVTRETVNINGGQRMD